MVIKFLEEKSTNEPQTVHVDRQLTTQGLTGANSADVMSNIYDLEGNNYEWTAQAEDADFRVRRGGNYDLAGGGHFGPASSRYYYNPDFSDRVYSSRSVLYL